VTVDYEELRTAYDHEYTRHQRTVVVEITAFIEMENQTGTVDQTLDKLTKRINAALNKDGDDWWISDILINPDESPTSE
jgi:hypothetical protein